MSVLQIAEIENISNPADPINFKAQPTVNGNPLAGSVNLSFNGTPVAGNITELNVVGTAAQVNQTGTNTAEVVFQNIGAEAPLGAIYLYPLAITSPAGFLDLVPGQRTQIDQATFPDLYTALPQNLDLNEIKDYVRAGTGPNRMNNVYVPRARDDMFLVADPFKTDPRAPSGSSHGMVTVFRKVGADWLPVQDLVPSTYSTANNSLTAESGVFGQAVAISDNGLRIAVASRINPSFMDIYEEVAGEYVRIQTIAGNARLDTFTAVALNADGSRLATRFKPAVGSVNLQLYSFVTSAFTLLDEELRANDYFATEIKFAKGVQKLFVTQSGPNESAGISSIIEFDYDTILTEVGVINDPHGLISPPSTNTNFANHFRSSSTTVGTGYNRHSNSNFVVSADGTRLIACADVQDLGLGSVQVGAVHLFEKVGSSWVYQSSFNNPGLVNGILPSYGFGSSIDANDDLTVIFVAAEFQMSGITSSTTSEVITLDPATGLKTSKFRHDRFVTNADTLFRLSRAGTVMTLTGSMKPRNFGLYPSSPAALSAAYTAAGRQSLACNSDLSLLMVGHGSIVVGTNNDDNSSSSVQTDLSNYASIIDTGVNSPIRLLPALFPPAGTKYVVKT